MTRLLLALAATLFAAPALDAQQYNIDQNLGLDTFGDKSTGQTFTPSVGITPDPGSPPTIALTSITLYHGNFSDQAPSATTFLNIYDGDPFAGGAFIGSSSNSIDTTPGFSFHTPMAWSFDKLDLVYTTEHWAVMSSTNTAGGLDVAVSLETQDRNIINPSVYTGGTGLIANHVPHQNLIDAKFNIVLEDSVGSFTLTGAGCPSSTGQQATLTANVPAVGQNFTATLSNTTALAFPVLALGFSDTSWALGPLPFPLSNLFSKTPPGCDLFVSPDKLFNMTHTPPTAAKTLPIPSDTSLVGATFFVQGLQLEFVAGPNVRLSTTAYGTAVIGP